MFISLHSSRWSRVRHWHDRDQISKEGIFPSVVIWCWSCIVSQCVWINEWSVHGCHCDSASDWSVLTPLRDQPSGARRAEDVFFCSSDLNQRQSREEDFTKTRFRHWIELLQWDTLMKLVRNRLRNQIKPLQQWFSWWRVLILYQTWR